MQRMERDRKEIERLIRSVKAWEEKTRMYEEALETACEEMEHKLILPEERYKSCILHHFTDTQSDCDWDCGVCQKNYFLGKGQERLDMQKACQDEEEGRKRMDVQDQQKAMTENITLESLDDIVRRAEGLGRELEEKMRR